MKTCPQCGYERTKTDDDFISAEECPRCGIFYKKWTPPSDSQSNKPTADEAESVSSPKPAKIELQEEPPEKSGLVNVRNIIALLLLIDSTILLIANVMGLPDVIQRTDLPFSRIVKYLYDFSMAGAFLITSFGLFQNKKWARMMAVVLLSMSLAEGLYGVMHHYQAVHKFESHMKGKLSADSFEMQVIANQKKKSNQQILLCMLTVYFIASLFRRKDWERYWLIISSKKASPAARKKTSPSVRREPIRFSVVVKPALIAIFILISIVGITYIVKETILKKEGAGVDAVSAGRTHTLALNKGEVWAWGYNSYGQLGNGAIGGMDAIPKRVKGLTDVIAIKAGYNFSVALKQDGTVWTWGNNERGQSGNKTDLIINAKPIKVDSIAGVIAIEAGDSHVLALKRDGTVWGWGNNSMGELGDGTRNNQATPVQLPGLNDILAISSKLKHSLALRKDGTVWAWGWNEFGQLGDGTRISRYEPVRVNGIINAEKIAAGGTFSAAIKKDGSIWHWGGDHESRPGHLIFAVTPHQIYNDIKPVSIAAGDGHLLILKKNGTIQLCGNGIHGKRRVLEDFDGVSGIACGFDNSFAIKKDGSFDFLVQRNMFNCL